MFLDAAVLVTAHFLEKLTLFTNFLSHSYYLAIVNGTIFAQSNIRLKGAATYPLIPSPPLYVVCSFNGLLPFLNALS